MDMIEELEAMRKRVLQEINAEFDLMIARMERMEEQEEVPYESTYSLTAGAGIFRGTKPTSVIFPDGKQADVRSWKDVAEAVMKRCVEDRKEAAKKQEAVYEKRPELSITEYADYLSRPGYGVKKKCDMELFLALLSLNMTDSRALQKKRTRRA